MDFRLPAFVETDSVLVPLAGEPGQFLSVWADGSFSRWTPAAAA